MNSEVKEQNKPYRKMGRGRERSKVKSGTVIASGDPPLTQTAILIGGMIVCLSHKERKTFMVRVSKW